MSWSWPDEPATSEATTADTAVAGHVVRVRHLSYGWHRWRVECSCGWVSLPWPTSSQVADAVACQHAYESGGTVTTGYSR